jgi:histidine kinase
MRLYGLGLKETRRLERMIENVLVAGRLRAERFDVQLTSVPLRPLLEEFVERRRLYRPDRPDALRLCWELKGEAGTVRADPAALRMIFDNLIDNAFKYGGEQPTIELHVVDQDGRIRVAVEDRGIGFPPDRAEDLFVPFRRALDSKGAVLPGTGLGLSIARTLARRMGGDLTARSDGPDRGSTFTVALVPV